MSQGRLTRHQTALHALDFERCRRSAHYFIFDSGVLITKDEQIIEGVTGETEKRFPDRSNLRVVLDCLLVSGNFISPTEAKYAVNFGYDPEFLEQLYFTRIFAIEKSRDLMATWICLAYIHWRCKFHPNQLALVQSKKEEDAAALVYTKEPNQARISFMESKLPRHIQTLTFPKAGSYCHVFYPNGSHVWAIPEGGHIIRSHHPSIIFSDEAGFQAEFWNAYTSARPAMANGGQYVAISTAEPGEFQQFVEAA